MTDEYDMFLIVYLIKDQNVFLLIGHVTLPPERVE